MVLGSGNYLLKWNDFVENSSSTFKCLRNDKDFTNVTLAWDGNQQIEAHKVILSASSIFFDNILRQSKQSYPFIYFRGVKSRDLVSILDFMYNGEASIPQDNLEEFMIVATELQIKGLQVEGAGIRTNEGQNKSVCDNAITNTLTTDMLRTAETQIKVETSNDRNVLFSEETHTTDLTVYRKKNSTQDFESLDSIINKAKAISAELFQLNLTVQLCNSVIV